MSECIYVIIYYIICQLRDILSEDFWFLFGFSHSPQIQNSHEYTCTVWKPRQSLIDRWEETGRQVHMVLSVLLLCCCSFQWKEGGGKVAALISSVLSIGCTWYDKGYSFVCPNVTLPPNYHIYTLTRTHTHTLIYIQGEFKCSPLNS